MDLAPPLNLSTSIKVKDSISNVNNNNDNIPEKGELIQQTDDDQSFVLLEHLPNSSEGAVSNGEKEVDNAQVESNCTLTNKDFEDGNQEHVIPREQVTSDAQVEINNTLTSKDFEAETAGGNESTETYACSHCSEIFLRANQLRSHEKIHVEEKVHMCDHCLETFPRWSLFLRHKQEHSKRTYECSDCDVPLNSYSAFRQHMKNHKGEKKFKCSDCPKTFLQQSHLITHKRKHTGEKPFPCHQCHTKFKQVSHLTTHLRTHTKDKPYICDICNASFSQTGSLKRHRRSHTGERPFKCKKCEAVFVEKRNLQRHLLSHSGIRPFKCDLCSASFTQYIDLKRHKQSHSGVKPHKCDVCDAAFSRKNNLKWHKLTHEGDTPHVCDICNVGFRIGRDLKQHKRSHVENKPYSCEHCKASFLQLTTLKRHVNIHTGCKPFSCDLCHATFFERVALKRHAQRHDPVKPYSCNHCGSTFLNPSTLKRHKFVVHSDGKYDNETKSSSVVKHIDSLEPTTAAEDENSLHICEPSYQKPANSSEQNIIVEGSVQAVTREMPQAVNEDLENGGQISTFLVAQPGQLPRAGRPVENCQSNNIQAHYHIFEGTSGQWQTWCFCETPNVRNTEISNVDAETHSVISQSEVINVNYHPNPQSYCNSVVSIKGNVSHSDVESLEQQQQQQQQSIDRSHNAKAQCLTENLFHSSNVTTAATSAHLDNFHSSDSSFHHFGNQVTSYTSNLSVTHNREQIQATNADLLHNAPVSVEKKTTGSDKNYISIPVCTQMESNYTLSERAHERLQKESENINYNGKGKKSLGSDCVKPNEIITPNGVNKITLQYDTKQPKEAHGYQNSHITPDNTDQETLIKESIKVHSYNENAKNNFIERQTQQTMLVNKGKELCASDLSSFNASHSPLSNISQNSKIPTENIQEYHIPVTVYDQISPTVSNNFTKEPVTLQYSVTVNNPATGAIQIQSELFPAKPENSSTRQPIKKRKIMKTIKEKFSCSYCSKSFSNKNQFILHERRHTGEKPFICGVCNQSFAHTNSLSIHMRNHTGEKPFSCNYCGAAFTQKSNLSVHLRVHTGEKPFKCDVCESAFSQGSHLIAHKRIHNNDRPYVCATCGQAFTQKSALKRHEVKHSALKPFSCITCKTKFTEKENLSKHTALHSLSRKDRTSIRRCAGKPVKKKNNDRPEDTSSKTLNETSKEESLVTLRLEVNANNEKNNNKKQTHKTSIIKLVGSKSKELIEPVRTSIRLKEAAEKRKYKPKDSDFITGDLDEIDRVEELEIEMAQLTRNVPNTKKLKTENLKSESKEVQSWCFCEVPHGPNEPHTDDKLDCGNSQSHQITSNVIVNNDACREGLLQLALPQLSHTVVLQSDQIALHPQNPNPNMSNVAHLSVPSNNIITSAVEESQVLSTGNSEGQFIGPETIVPSQDINSHVGSNDSKAMYGNAQIISGQFLPNGHFVPQDGAIFIEASDLLNSSTGTVVVNAAPGTIFFDIPTEGQLLNVPLNASVGHESVIVAGSSCLDAGIHSSEADPIYVTSAEQNVANTLSLSARDSQTNAFLSSSVPSSSTVITNSEIMNSVQPSVVSSFGNEADVSAPTIPYVQVENGDIGLLNSTITFEQSSAVNTNQNASVKVKGSAGKIQPIIVNISKCSVCGKEFASKNTLKQHIKFNHQGLHFCTVCFDAFTTKEHLNTHKLQQHKSSTSCPECNQHFSTKSSLNHHRVKEHNAVIFTSKKDNKIYSCTKCKAAFSMISDLNRHVLSHTGIKPFKCKQCGAAFTRKSSLNKHERIHTGEKPYTCKDCGQSFVYRYQINRHKTVHENSEQSSYSMPYVYSN